MAHLDEQTIELYVMRSDAVRTRRKEIAAHLRHCKGCAALHAEIKQYYSQVEKLEREQAERASQALYAPETAIRRRTTEGAAVVQPEPGSLSQRFVTSFKQYPLRWSAGVALMVATLALLAPSSSSTNRNPAYARAQKDFLVAYNDQRDELWRTFIGLNIDDDALPEYIADDSARGFPVLDVDRDGTNEIIGVYGWGDWTVQENPWLNVLACYKADGSLRWKYELHRNITLHGTPFSDDYRFYKTQAGDFDGDGRMEVLGLASHIPWFPNVLVRLDAETGELMSEYWHNGMLGYTAWQDIDHDGVKELFLAGQNNRFQRANLLVFDPRTIEGTAPAPPEYTPDGIPPGSEKFYLLLPASGLQPYWSDITNEVTGLFWRSDSTLEVWVRERIAFVSSDTSTILPYPYEDGSIHYSLDRSMRCVRVRASDSFTAIWSKYRRRGLVKDDLDEAYFEKLRQGVQYWDGEKFVGEPVMNKRYLEFASQELNTKLK